MVSSPSNIALYNSIKEQAKRKFDVWPSAYASAWLVKTYKKHGGTYSGSSKPKSYRKKPKSKSKSYRKKPKSKSYRKKPKSKSYRKKPKSKSRRKKPKSKSRRKKPKSKSRRKKYKTSPPFISHQWYKSPSPTEECQLEWLSDKVRSVQDVPI